MERSCGWMRREGDRPTRLNEDTRAVDAVDTSLGGLYGRCAALEILMDSRPLDTALFAAEQEKLRRTLIARSWPFPKPLLCDTLEKTEGHTRFTSLYESSLAARKKGAEPAKLEVKSDDAGGSSSESECESEEDDASVTKDEEEVDPATMEEAEFESSEEESESDSGGSEDESEGSDEEEEEGRMDKHFKLLGRLGCYTSMRRQCTDEVRAVKLLPIVPSHLVQLAKLAGRLMDGATTKEMNSAIQPYMKQLEGMLDKQKAAKNDDEILPKMKSDADIEQFTSVAQTVIETIDAYTRKAHAMDLITYFIPAVSHTN